MRRNLARIALVLAGPVMMSGAVQAAIITTATGTNGADSWVQANSAGTNNGSSQVVNVRTSDSSTGTVRNDLTYLRFDISSIQPGTVTNASLGLYNNRAPLGGSYNRKINVYGLLNGDAGDSATGWTESGINYNNAPGLVSPPPTNGSSSGIDSTRTVLLGYFTTGGTTGDLISTGDLSALASFLNADTNGLVTLILATDDTTNSNQERYASKEATSLSSGPAVTAGTYAPRLEVSVAIPEPASLGGLGVMGLALRRRARRA